MLGRQRSAGDAPGEEEMIHGASMMPGAPMMRSSNGPVTAIAVAVPRQLQVVKNDVLFEAAEMGDEFFYSWTVSDKNSPTKKSVIEGMSIEGAMMLQRNWGNCTTTIGVESESPTHWTFIAVFIDYQTGFSGPRLFRQRKGMSFGKMEVDRAQDIAYQIGCSKAIRNAVDKAMPSWLRKAGMVAAHLACEKRYSNIEKSLAEARSYFAQRGVSDAQLLAKIGKPFIDWLARDFVVLSSIASSIKQGLTTVGIEFADDPAPAAEPEIGTAPVDAAHAAGQAAPEEPSGPPRVQPPPPTPPAAVVAPPAVVVTPVVDPVAPPAVVAPVVIATPAAPLPPGKDTFADAFPELATAPKTTPAKAPKAAR
jgi:hypothetical protein